MMFRNVRPCILLFVSLLLAGAASTAAARPRVYAVVVGVFDYDDPSVKDLPIIKQEAVDVARALLEYAGVEKRDLFLLTSENRWATRNGVLSVLHYVRRKVRPGDTVIFFFSGHGASFRGYSYLLPQDYDRNRIDRTAIRHDELNALLAGTRAKWTLVVLDACHSGFGIRGKAGHRLGPFRPARLYGVGSGRAVIASSRQDEVTWSNVFAPALVQGLSGQADKDKDGEVTLMELWAYLEREVPRMTRDTKQPQHPVFHANLSSRVVVSRPARRRRVRFSRWDLGALAAVRATVRLGGFGLTFCNRTPWKMWLAYALPTSESSRLWQVRGWYAIQPGACRKVNNEDMRDKGQVAYYAEAEPKRMAVLTGRLGFCIPSKAFSFTVRQAVECVRDERLYHFRVVSLKRDPLAHAATIDLRTPSSEYERGLVICNKTNEKVWTAIGYWDGERRTWTSKGWWDIEPGRCKRPYNKSLRGRRYIYVHAHSKSAAWTGQYNFCTVDDPFTIRGLHETCPEGQNPTSFRQVDLGPDHRRDMYVYTLVP